MLHVSRIVYLALQRDCVQAQFARPCIVHLLRPANSSTKPDLPHFVIKMSFVIHSSLLSFSNVATVGAAVPVSRPVFAQRCDMSASCLCPTATRSLFVGVLALTPPRYAAGLQDPPPLCTATWTTWPFVMNLLTLTSCRCASRVWACAKFDCQPTTLVHCITRCANGLLSSLRRPPLCPRHSTVLGLQLYPCRSSWRLQVHVGGCSVPDRNFGGYQKLTFCFV